MYEIYPNELLSMSVDGVVENVNYNHRRGIIESSKICDGIQIILRKNETEIMNVLNDYKEDLSKSLLDMVIEYTDGKRECIKFPYYKEVDVRVVKDYVLLEIFPDYLDYE